MLAGIDPEGNCTNGIVRHYSSKNFWNADSLQDFTFTWPPERYLNFYIVKSINLAPAYTFYLESAFPIMRMLWYVNPGW
ncbi:MAG: hypothetical protein IPI30_23080 [Saprospiraceae bacterium]|nr:hypothetical protein [Candidatus Vicinibacter affinis]